MDFEIEIDNVENENAKKIQEDVDVTPADIVSRVEEKLSEEDKKIIEKNKKKRKSNTEVKKIEVTTDWNENELSEEEKLQSKQLQASLSTFLMEKADISEGDGVIDTLPTGIDVLDAILGGGFASGAFSILAGMPGTFKSSLLGQIIGTSQKKYKGKLLTAYKDSENSMSSKRLYQLGVKNPPIKPIPQVSVESVFRTVEAFCAFKELNKIVETPSIVAWDSIANTATEKERESDTLDPSKVMGLKARILSSCLPRYVSKMREYNVSLIAVNQLRDKIDMGMFPTANSLRYLGQSKTMPGGNSVQFNAFHLVLLKTKSDLKMEQWGFNGVLLEAKCVKNKFFTPNIPVELIVDFNCGISNFWTNYNFLVKTKRIKPGAWGSLLSYPEVKWQGTAKCLEKYNTDEKFKEAFDKIVKETIQTEIIDRYTDYENLEGFEDDNDE